MINFIQILFDIWIYSYYLIIWIYFFSIHECNLSNWLSHQEDIHRIVVYQADMTMTEWTKRCIRQADAIMIVGRVDEDPQVGKVSFCLYPFAFLSLPCV